MKSHEKAPPNLQKGQGTIKTKGQALVTMLVALKEQTKKEVEELIQGLKNSKSYQIIIKKTTGNVSAVSFDSGEALSERTAAFDTFVQVIDGTAEILIDGELNLLETGQSIIIPAHSRNTIRANVRFKMLSTIIKSGYEELS